MSWPCNCNGGKVDDKCPYGGKCRETTLVYKVTCTVCDKQYIGNTQQTLKERMNGHYQDVRYLVKIGKHSDSFAKHFAEHFVKGEAPLKKGDIGKICAGDVRNICKFDIIWKGDPIAVSKGFKTRSCRLCQSERKAILKAIWEEPERVINSSNEIHGACRHNPKFHRLMMNASTDERGKREKVAPAQRAPNVRFRPLKVRRAFAKILDTRSSAEVLEQIVIV